LNSESAAKKSYSNHLHCPDQSACLCLLWLTSLIAAVAV